MDGSFPPASRGPYAQGRLRRREIVDATLDALADAGRLDVALDEVASRVGISRQGVLHHFGSRDDLLVAVLEERDRRDIEASRQERREGERPEAILERALRRSRNSPELARLYTSLAADAADPSHPAHEYFVRRYGQLRDQVQESLKAEIAAGTLEASVSVESASQLILAILDGLQIQWLLDPELDATRSLRDAIRVLLPSAGNPVE